MGVETTARENGGGLGVAAQNIAAENPRAAVGTTRGMSMRVSKNLFPLNVFRASIQATGRPTMKSMTVTMAAISKETMMELTIRSIVAGSLSTLDWISDQSVTA